MGTRWRRNRRSDLNDLGQGFGKGFGDYDDAEDDDYHASRRRSARDAAPVPRLDLWLAAFATVAAACCAAFLPEGNLARMLLTAPAWLFLPGYLVLQAILIPVRPPGRRALHAIAAIGLSPPIVGLLALSTLLFPRGLTAGSIITVVTVVCLLLAVIAGMRRTSRPAGDDGMQRAPPAVEAFRRPARGAATPGRSNAASSNTGSRTGSSNAASSNGSTQAKAPGTIQTKAASKG